MTMFAASPGWFACYLIEDKGALALIEITPIIGWISIDDKVQALIDNGMGSAILVESGGDLVCVVSPEDDWSKIVPEILSKPVELWN